jgi:hypothetical protein
MKRRTNERIAVLQAERETLLWGSGSIRSLRMTISLTHMFYGFKKSDSAMIAFG